MKKFFMRDPIVSSFVERPELTINSKHVSISLEVIGALNILRSRTLLKNSAEPKTCERPYASKLEKWK